MMLGKCSVTELSGIGLGCCVYFNYLRVSIHSSGLPQILSLPACFLNIETVGIMPSHLTLTKDLCGAGEQLRALAFLAENLISVPRTHMLAPIHL